MTQSNLRTSLYSTHLDLGARIVPFGGWDMPVQYSGILGEVSAVRNGAGLFDVSHMGRIHVAGPQATEFLDWVLTGSVESLRVGRARYCLICNERGGVIDDTIFYRLAEHRYLLIPNAGNRITVATWFQRWIDQRFPRRLHAGGPYPDHRFARTPGTEHSPDHGPNLHPGKRPGAIGAAVLHLGPG